MRLGSDQLNILQTKYTMKNILPLFLQRKQNLALTYDAGNMLTKI